MLSLPFSFDIGVCNSSAHQSICCIFIKELPQFNLLGTLYTIDHFPDISNDSVQF